MPKLNLTTDPNNANKGTPRGQGLVEHSLRNYGAGRSILVDKHGVAIAGNKTLERAQELGIPIQVIQSDGKTLYAIQRTDLDLKTDTAAKELGIADNRSSELGLDWNPDILQSFIDDGVDLDQFWFEAELDVLLAGDGKPVLGLTDPDSVPDIPDDPTTKPGDLWLLGDHRLLCGDSTVSTDVDRLMDGQKADMVWTDPPYGVAIGTKNKFLNTIGTPANRVEEDLINDTLDEIGLRSLLRESFENAVAVCTAGAVWHVTAPAVPLHVIFGEELKRLGIWRQTIQWVKNNSTFSPMGVDYHWQAEPIFHGWVPGKRHQYFGDRKQTTVWNIDRPTASPDHPTMKPVELIDRALTHHTAPGQLVYDPFLGSGSTIISAEHINRTCYGMEIDPKYCDVIVKRWEQFTGNTAILSATTALQQAAD